MGREHVQLRPLVLMFVPQNLHTFIDEMFFVLAAQSHFKNRLPPNKSNLSSTHLTCMLWGVQMILCDKTTKHEKIFKKCCFVLNGVCSHIKCFPSI